MNNPFKRFSALKQAIRQQTKRGAKVRFASCGQVLIDGLPFAFSVASDGDQSGKGFCISFSGEPVEKGELTFDVLELRLFKNGRTVTQKKKLAKIVKKDGKHIFQARFPELELRDCGADTKGRSREEQFLGDIASTYSFKVTPHYTGAEDGEVMLTCYPFEEPLNGLAVEWKPCTADRDWFEHNPEKLTKKKR
ncbi:MAG: hypothetical protein IJ746_00945 [Ruminococcus sp.]|nr:hypothetical protein [Ruminococcus sp.]